MLRAAQRQIYTGINFKIITLNNFKKLINTKELAETKDHNGLSIIFHAILHSRLDIIKYMVGELEIEINHPDGKGVTALMAAAHFGHFDIVKYMIEKGANIRAKADDESGLLLYACDSGNLDIVKYLINEKSFNPLEKNANGRDALQIAVAYGRVEVARYLIEELKVDIHTKDINNNNIVNIAAQENNIDMLRYLKTIEGLDFENGDIKGNTPLFGAILEKHLDNISYLLDECGANINARNINGVTPFIMAARHGYLEGLTYFARNGADINAVTMDGTNALSAAMEKGALDAIKYLCENLNISIDSQNKHGLTPLMFASYYGRRDIVTYLLSKGANKQLKTIEGKTASLLALEQKKFDIADILEDDINSADNNGNTALIEAVNSLNIETINYLLNHPTINCNLQNIAGITALMIAVDKANLDIVKKLVKVTDLKITDHNGNTALQFAISNKQIGIAKILINEGNVDQHLLDRDGHKLLFNAVIYGESEVVKLLIEKGASPFLMDKNKSSLLHYAALYGHLGVLKCLVENNIDYDAQDVEGYTPLMLAAMNGHIDVVKYLFEEKNALLYSFTTKGAVTALNLAASHGKLATLIYIAGKAKEFGLSVDYQDAYGFSPLLIAAAKGQINIVKYLINKCNANRNLKTIDGKTIIDLAKESGNPELSAYLELIEPCAEENIVTMDFNIAFNQFTSDYNNEKFFLKISALLGGGFKPINGFLKELIDYQTEKSLSDISHLINPKVISQILLAYPESSEEIPTESKLILAASLTRHIDEQDTIEPLVVRKFLESIVGCNERLYYSMAVKIVDKVDCELLSEHEQEIYSIICAAKTYKNELGYYPNLIPSEINIIRKLWHKESSVTVEFIKTYKNIVEIIKHLPDWARKENDIKIINAEAICRLNEILNKNLTDVIVNIDLLLDEKHPAKQNKKKMNSAKKIPSKKKQDDYPEVAKLVSNIMEIFIELNKISKIEDHVPIIKILLGKIGLLIGVDNPMILEWNNILNDHITPLHSHSSTYADDTDLFSHAGATGDCDLSELTDSSIIGNVDSKNPD